jgi:hypothetical protein
MIVPLILFAATVAISLFMAEDAFAKDGRYSGDTSQAASVSNECLNSILDSNTIDNLILTCLLDHLILAYLVNAGGSNLAVLSSSKIKHREDKVLRVQY